MAIKAGTVADFADSMAAAIEEAMEQEYQAVKGEALSGQGQEDRRLLFVAIAQGVVRHLKGNLDAWKIEVETELVDSDDAEGTGEVEELETTGTLYS